MLHTVFIFFFQAEDGIRDIGVTGVQTCALPIWRTSSWSAAGSPGLPPRARSRPPGGRRSWSRRASASAGGRSTSRSADRKSVVEGKRVDLGGRRIIKNKK